MKRKWEKRLILDDVEGLQMRRRREAEEELRLWKLSACFFFLVSCALLWYSEICKSASSGLSALDSPSFPTKQIKFAGGLKYNPDGELYRDNSPEDETFAKLERDFDILWSFFEAAQDTKFDHGFVDASFVDRHEKAITGPDVFYQLHCLSMIRKELSAEPSLDTGTVQNHKRYIDHCLDYVRQALMCHADTTPVKLYYDESTQRPIIDSEAFHTCSDFDPIKDWRIHNDYQNSRQDLAH